MKIIQFISAILMLTLLNLFAGQNELYIPFNIQQAYKNHTRSFDGTPGENYWQNRADYRMDVTVYPWSRLLKGVQTIQYFNNSPDTLKEIVIKLYPDLYKYGNKRDDKIAAAALHDGVVFTEFKINNRFVDLNSKEASSWRTGTLLIVPLKDYLNPGSSLKVESQWQYTIPNISQIRGGAYDASSFFVSYWYPRIAVYDDLSGWDKFSYTGDQEFYNDFGNYDVSINLPDGYTAWATGILQNPKMVLPVKQFNLYQQAHATDKIVNIITQKDYYENGMVMNPDKNPWHFKAQNVTDFAFAFSDYYLWDAGSVKIPGHDEDVFVAAAYKPESNDFYEVARIAAQAVEFFSQEMPGINFPFPELTVFNGKGGMEFPMMINDGTTTTYASTVGLTSHEAMHSYFPFYMGTNEKKYAWMDEGLVVALCFDFQHKMAPDRDLVASRVEKYLRIAGDETEAPSMISSLHMRDIPYRNAAYDKPAMAYYFLRDFLGDDVFKKALHTYIDHWHGKHPMPYDFFFTFNRVSGQDLSWYWKPWFFEFAYPDLAIKDIKDDTGKNRIVVKKSGRMPLPVELLITFDDGSSQKVYKNAAIWQNGESEKIIDIDTDKKIRKILLGSEHIPDIDLSNNQWPAE